MKRILTVCVLSAFVLLTVGCSMMGNNQKLLDDLKAAQDKVTEMTNEKTELEGKISDLEEQIDKFGDMDIEEIDAEMERLGEENVQLKLTNDSLVQVIEKLKAGSSSGGGSSGGHPDLGPQIIIE
ncbi:hypothetical protein JXA84_06435 [candidate division WOR-3 bacterium]|nr:hypothetical protein [candidate division WOR-3 bacterium]